METDPSTPASRSDKLRWVAIVVALVAIAAAAAWYLQGAIPRRIVMATGAKDGMYHELAKRYQAILARDGVTLVERMTAGAGENAALLLDPKSGVDVAFVQGGVVPRGEERDVVMLASLYFEPLWVFYRGSETLTQVDELRYKRLAVGAPGSGTRVFADAVLAANNVTTFNSTFVPLGNVEALRALQAGTVDALFLVGPVDSPAIRQALYDGSLKLLSFAWADAYPRKFPWITKVTLPAGTIDLAQRIPPQDVKLVASEAMLAARDSLPAALVNLLFEAAREIHGGQGVFEAPREFPNTDPVDLPVSVHAERHNRFGDSLLHRHLPFFVATFLERLLILLIPLVAIIVPLVNLLPQVLRWRVRSRILRWYGELALLEREVARSTGTAKTGEWLERLARIESAAEHIRAPVSYAAESYTLREHIALVRNAVLAKSRGATTTA